MNADDLRLLREIRKDIMSIPVSVDSEQLEKRASLLNRFDAHIDNLSTQLKQTQVVSIKECAEQIVRTCEQWLSGDDDLTHMSVGELIEYVETRVPEFSIHLAELRTICERS